MELLGTNVPTLGGSLEVQWLGLGACTAIVGSVPGQGNRILQAMQCGQKKKKKKHIMLIWKERGQTWALDIWEKRKKAGQISWRLVAGSQNNLIVPVKGSLLTNLVIRSRVKNQTNKPPRDFPDGAVVKNLPCNTGDEGSIPGWGSRFHMPQDNWICAPRLLQQKSSLRQLIPDAAK